MVQVKGHTRITKKKETWRKDPLYSGMWIWGDRGYVLWVGLNNKVYLATSNFKDVIYHGKSQTDAQQKLKKATKMSPADIRYHGLL